MKIKILSRNDARLAMEQWQNIFPELPPVEEDYQKIREEIQRINTEVRNDAEKASTQKKDYFIDAHFGLRLYEYLMSLDGFTLRAAANDGFWRYLSVQVAPDVVAQRWGRDNADHFWKMSNRNWFRSLWWYVHLAWQGDMESTRKVLESSHFTTDTILNFEERTGRKGTCVAAYRRIIYYYSTLSDDTMKLYAKNRKNSGDNLFRVVMKLNTAKMMVMEPALCKGGEDGYARQLFQDIGVIV